MNVWIKRTGWFCLTPICLVLLLSILLYIPPIQNFAADKAAAYAGEATGLQFHIDKIRLSFPLDLTVKGVHISQTPADTVLQIKSLTVQIKALPLLKKEVVVNGLKVKDVHFNSRDLIEGMRVKGFLEKLNVQAHPIDLSSEKATLNAIDLANTTVTLILTDSISTPPDTTSAPLNWVLALEKINLDRVALALQMPHDSLRLISFINKGEVKKGVVDLGKETYKADHLQLINSLLSYDGNYRKAKDGLDYDHIFLSPVNASIDSLSYAGKNMNAVIKQLTMKEKSGLEVVSTTGKLYSTEEQIYLPKLEIKTLHSKLDFTSEIPWSSIDSLPQKELKASLKARLGKEDLLLMAGQLPSDFTAEFPDKPLTIQADVVGNLSELRVTKGDLQMPDAIDLKLRGKVKELQDSNQLSGVMQMDAVSGDLDFLLAMLPKAERKRFAIPSGMTFEGKANFTSKRYQAELILREDHGKIDFVAQYDPKKETYAAKMIVDSLEPIHFMPEDSLLWVTAAIDAKGKGTDLFHKNTVAQLRGKIKNIRYGVSSVSDISIKGSLVDHALDVKLKSKYPLAKMELDLQADLRKEKIQAMFIADVEHANLHGLKLINYPLSTSFQLFAEAESDLNEMNKLDITLGNWDLTTQKQHFKPKTLTLHARTNEDTTRVSFHAGDLGIVLTGKDCIHDISKKLSDVSASITKQLKEDSTANLQILKPLLPEMDVKVQAGQDNPIYNYLEAYYTDFKGFNLNAYMSPETGVRMDAAIYELAQDTMLIDTIRAEIYQDTLGLVYNADVIKKKYRKQIPFSAGVYGNLRHRFGNAHVYYKNGKGETGLSLEVQAEKLKEGMRFHLLPYEPIIAFRSFKLNKDNYITMRNLKDIDADLRITGPNNAYIWVHSQDQGDMYKEAHVELSQIDLDVLSKAFNYFPPMTGFLNADFKYAPTDSTFMVVSDVNVKEFYYEEERVGDLMLNAVYLPLEQNEHQLDVHVFRDWEEISSLFALYRSGKTDYLDGTMDFIHFPLDMLNPFVPEDMVKMRGTFDGSLSLSGTSDSPQAKGFLRLDTASVFVGAVGSSFRFDNKSIEIENNQLLLDQFGIYAYNKEPFIIDGKVDFSDLNNMIADLTLKANNLQLLNAKKTEKSLAYGKLFVNLNSSVKGPLTGLTMRGDLQLLGNTNLSYVLKDSPLAVQDRLSGLVNFTSFADTVRRRMPKKPPLPVGGLDMLMTIRIDPAVQVNVDLSEDESNRINLEGGGDLSFQYTPQGDMFLNGRYTLTGGTVKYSIPVIPLKEFTIKEGSYVQWTGNPMDPSLNLIATERIRTSVTSVGQTSPRLVNFDVGIKLTQKLENLGLQFTLEAPEDLAMQEELTSKGIEEQSKLAVSMLVTGMYLGNTGNGKINMNMGNALSSFLQSEINNIAGKALKTVDISFGMDTYDNLGETGGSRTDYSFRFAKRFYNDRIRIILGGRISTGEKINNGQTQTFIDNVSIEYRLDNSGSRYVKLFHDKNYESLLEGEIIETGAGIVLRKKMMKLRELFNFKKPKVKPENEEKNEN